MLVGFVWVFVLFCFFVVIFVVVVFCFLFFCVFFGGVVCCCCVVRFCCVYVLGSCFCSSMLSWAHTSAICTVSW